MSMQFVEFPPPGGGGGGGSNASVSANGGPIPGSSTLVAGEDPSGNQQPLQTNAAKELLVSQSANPINTSGSGSPAGPTVTTQILLTAPAKAVGFIIMNLDISTTNMRWSIGRTSSATLGQQLQPGRDSGFVPCGANVSICAESGTCTYDIQWVSQ